MSAENSERYRRVEGKLFANYTSRAEPLQKLKKSFSAFFPQHVACAVYQ